MSNLQRVIKLVFVIWVTSAVCALPLALQFGIHYEPLLDTSLTSQPAPEVALCTLKSPIQYSFELSTLLFFAIPLCLLTVLYIQIGLHLRRSEHAIVRQLTASNLHSPALASALASVNEPMVHRPLAGSTPTDNRSSEPTDRLLSATDPALSATASSAHQGGLVSGAVRGTCLDLHGATNGLPHLSSSSGSPTRSQHSDKKSSLRSQGSSGSFSTRLRSWKFFEQRSNSTRTMGASNNSRRAVIKMLGKSFVCCSSVVF
jgi:hypothetical protein